MTSVRIPVRFVDGRMECGYGGVVPLREGTKAELIVEAIDIDNNEFLAAMTKPGRHLALPEGSELLVGLNVKETKDFTQRERDLLMDLAICTQLGISLADRYAGFNHFSMFIMIKLAGPTDNQKELYKSTDGGLWLMTKGGKATALSSSTIKLPKEVSEEPVSSLNHALTLLSEKFEPWRISHTGNIYEQVFYREENGRWYNLDCLRNEKVIKNEMKIADKLWTNFLSKMSR